MNDWNGNGKQDSFDSFVDYHGANSGGKASSDWWLWVLGAMVVCVCPPLAIVIVIGICIFGR